MLAGVIEIEALVGEGPFEAVKWKARLGRFRIGKSRACKSSL